jgi:F-type H+-transporting ATPase subunit alpha
MKKVAGNLRLDLAQYRDLAAFAQFAADVDELTKKQIARGSRMMELLKQGQYQPMPVASQVAIMWVGAKGHLDDIPVARVTEFESQFISFVGARYRKLLGSIAKEKVLTPEIEKGLETAIAEFRKTFT